MLFRKADDWDYYSNKEVRKGQLLMETGFNHKFGLSTNCILKFALNIVTPLLTRVVRYYVSWIKHNKVVAP
jgi:hypothetical protein